MTSRVPFLFGVITGLLATPLHGQISFTANSTLLTGNYGNPGCVVDMNADHLDDVVRFSGNQLMIAYQQPNGTFVQQAMITATVSPGWSICAGDLDDNGYNDLLLGSGSASSFLLANGDGTAYTEQYFPPYIFNQRTNMADINNDGQLDGWSCHDVGLSKPYRNTGGGVMVEDQTMIQQTTTVGGNYATMFTDLDDDGDLDLYISKCRGGAPVGDPQRINLHYRNNGNGTWTEIGAASGLNDGAQSWVTVFEDFDNDGDFDAFIANHSDLNRFMRNNGDGTFTDIIGTTGINASDLGAWEAQGGDFDNDGWVDIFSEVGSGMYRNNGDGTFSNIAIGFSEGGIGDLNNDGWLDVQAGQTIRLNNGGTNHWVKFEMQGIFSNKNGIGARLRLYGPWGVQTREIRSGQGFSHMNSLQAHFGIGTATEIDSVVINWPSGVRTVMTNPGIDQLHIIPEASCTLSPIEIGVSGDTQLCAGETVELSAPDGFVTYQWSNGATDATIEVSTSGNYTVTAMDGGDCVALSNSVTVEMVEDIPPAITLIGEEVICEGSTVELISSIADNAVWSDGTVGPNLVVSEAGEYWVTVDGACASLSSETVTIEVNPAAELPIADDVTIPIPGTADLLAIGENIQWYADQNDVTPLASGNNWTTPFVNTTSTFWVEANAIYGGALQNGGKPDNSGGGGLPATGSHSFFTAWEPFTIEQVTVYAIGAGMRTVNLCDAAGVVLATASFNLAEGTHVLDLDFSVPVGVDLSLRCPEHSLFRNNAGVAYPYAIGTMGQLTNSGFGTSYYYYFYDWKVRTAQMLCPSERVPVTVNIGNVGIDETTNDEVRIYPVPATTEVRLDGVMAGERIAFYDAQGRLVLEENNSSDGTMTVPVDHLGAGAYLVRITGKERSLAYDMTITR